MKPPPRYTFVSFQCCRYLKHGGGDEDEDGDDDDDDDDDEDDDDDDDGDDDDDDGDDDDDDDGDDDDDDDDGCQKTGVSMGPSRSSASHPKVPCFATFEMRRPRVGCSNI